MARISAGSTLINQYVPPFVVAANVQNNWQLRWNDTLKAFEAFDPMADVPTEVGFQSIEQYGPVTANGAQSTWIIPWAIANEQSLIATIDGVKQHTTSFVATSVGSNSTSVTFGEPPDLGSTIEFIGLQANNSDDIKVVTALGTGVSPQIISLPWVAPSAAALIITVDGIKQHTTSYTLSISGLSTIVTFPTAPAFESDIEIVGITDTGERPASPVDATNLSTAPGTVGLYAGKTTAGETQILNFKSLSPGPGITFVQAAEYITIEADGLPTFQNTGTGQAVLVDPNANPLQFRALAADGDRLTATLNSGTITFAYRYGYVAVPGPTYVASANDRILGVTNAAAPVTITLPLGAAGVTVIVKDETGAIDAVNTVTVATAGTETIDGAASHTMTVPYDSITLYSNGSNWFVVG
jgi:hypothetical protein